MLKGKILHADWNEKMEAYRVYDETTPHKTIAFEENLFNIILWATQANYDDISIQRPLRTGRKQNTLHWYF